MTSIIILSYHTFKYLQKCIISIREHTKIDSYELIVVDNASQDGSVEWLRQQEDVYLICNKENVGYSKGCNQGAAVAKGDYIIFLNSDTIVTPHWLDNMKIALTSNERVGAVGPMADSCPIAQRVSMTFSSHDELICFATHFNKSNPLKWERHTVLTGFCMMVRHSLWKQLGGFDERFSPAYFEDDDLSLRIMLLGYDLLVCKDTFIHHEEKVSLQNEVRNGLLYKNQIKFQKKWWISDLYRECCPDKLRKYIRERDENGYVVRFGLHIYKNTEIFFYCALDNGLETNVSQHFLCKRLNDEGIRAFIIYDDMLKCNIPLKCEMYRVPVAKSIIDKKNNILIMSDRQRRLIGRFSEMRIYLI